MIFRQVGRLTQVVADRGYAPEVSVTVFGNLAWGKRSPEPNPPRQLNIGSEIGLWAQRYSGDFDGRFDNLAIYTNTCTEAGQTAAGRIAISVESGDHHSPGMSAPGDLGEVMPKLDHFC